MHQTGLVQVTAEASSPEPRSRSRNDTHSLRPLQSSTGQNPSVHIPTDHTPASARTAYIWHLHHLQSLSLGRRHPCICRISYHVQHHLRGPLCNALGTDCRFRVGHCCDWKVEGGGDQEGSKGKARKKEGQGYAFEEVRLAGWDNSIQGAWAGRGIQEEVVAPRDAGVQGDVGDQVWETIGHVKMGWG